MAWGKQTDEMTINKATAEVKADSLPLGYVVKKEPKKERRTFAMQKSLLEALKSIAADKGTNINALVNDVLTEYANDYLKKDKTK